jgi:hypothetical protein
VAGWRRAFVVEGVNAVGVDVLVAGGDEVGYDLVGHGLVGAGDGVAEVGGGPQDAGVRDEGVAVGLGGLVFVAGVWDLGSLGEDQVAAEGVEGLAPV